MSSILKALKKLENDKSICKPEQLRIDSKILQDGSSTKFSRTALVLIAVSLFACGGSVTYFSMKRSISARTEGGIVSQASSLRGETHTMTPPLQPVVKSEAFKTTTAPFLPAKPTSVIETRTHIPVDTLKTKQSQPANKVIASPLQVSLPESVPESKVSSPRIAVTRPVLTINGIAFQEGGNDNLAVINGITVSSGAMIEGVKVEGIQKDRVYFSQGGEKFEIILNKSIR